MAGTAAARAIYRRHGPRVRDVGAVVFGVFLTLLAVKTPWSPVARPVILVAGLTGSVALWWRRRWPGPTTLLGIAAFLLSGNPWPPIVGLSSTAASRRDRVLVAPTAAAGVGFALPDMNDLGRFDAAQWSRGQRRVAARSLASVGQSGSGRPRQPRGPRRHP